MINSKAFLGQTAEAASFAFREYFRPLVATVRFFASRRGSPKSAESAPENPPRLEDAKTILHSKSPRS